MVKSSYSAVAAAAALLLLLGTNPARAQETVPPVPTEAERTRAKTEAEVAEARAKARFAPPITDDTGSQTAAAILARQLNAAERAAAKERVAFEALSWVGVPRYLAGGDDLHAAVDAPHFVQQVFARAQLPLPSGDLSGGDLVHWNKGGEVTIGAGQAASRTQIMGVPPDLSVLRPGDLVFYGQDGSPFDGQVGIYVGRVRDVAHACVMASTHKGTVVVENMDAPENTSAYRYTLRPVLNDAVMTAGTSGTTAAAPAAAAAQWTPDGNIFVLAVGAGRYDRDSLNLKTPASGAERFVKRLQQTDGLAQRISDDNPPVVKQSPTKAEFFDAIYKASSKAGAGDVFILYYKGQADAAKLYPNAKPSEAVNVSDLTNALLQVPAGRILLIFDAPFVSVAGADWNRMGASGKMVMQWAAAHTNERALEDTYGKADPYGVPTPDGKASANGVFSYFLMKSLTGADEDKNGSVSAEQIAGYVKTAVQNDTLDMQNPLFAATGGSGGGLQLKNVVLFTRRSPKMVSVADGSQKAGK